MATKTVINANVPQTRGISIIIDQDQAQQLKQQQKQQQQVVICKQQLEAAKINIYQNTTATIEPATRSTVEISMQEMSPKSPPATPSTFTDINRNGDNDAENAHYKHGEYNNDDHKMDKETSCTTITTTTATTNSTSTKAIPHLLLKVDSEEPVISCMSERGGKLGEKVELAVGKLQANTKKESNGDCLENVGGVSITHEQYGSNGIGGHSGAITGKKTIIQCNKVDNNNYNDDNDVDDEEDEYNDEDPMKHNKESRCNGIGSGNGQLLLNGMSGSDRQHQQQQQQQQLQKQQLENGFATKSLNSLTTKAVCASALTESVKYAAKDSHVVMIQIKPPIIGENSETENTSTLRTDKQVTVVKLNDSVRNLNTRKESVAKSDLLLDIEKMVQKPMGISTTSVGQSVQNTGNISSGSTTVTELNVSSHPSYLYYVMSSGQFSPCDTLDSGTGSDLESNGNLNGGTPSPKVVANGSSCGNGNGSSSSGGGNGAPKLELHLKTTKIRVNKAAMVMDKQNRNAEHLRAGSLTDSEESESSSLSCDSLHSTEFMRQSSVSPTGKASTKDLAAFLPDSLLRDIRDRKFPNNDFEDKYGDNCAHQSLNESVNGREYSEAQEVAEHVKFLQEYHNANTEVPKRGLMPNKTFVLNQEDGTFIDTKMNSMPRKYEADKFYNFHVNEHENFRSFGNGIGGDGGLDETASLSEYETKTTQDDAFAGYKDIRCGSGTSTIRSSKGTVRGVKNRVRNGIATFLQLQQPNVKNYKEKDLGKVVLYTTSMGIIRDTYAKCSNVKQILRTLLVKFEERDVFMSIEYQQEIRERMHSETIRVPQLFVEGQHIGDAETVERLNESGELRQLLKPYKSIATIYTCQTCGGYRLLPCPSCNGSKKSVHRNHFTAEFVALKCMNCDEVGLVKCHNC